MVTSSSMILCHLLYLLLSLVNKNIVTGKLRGDMNFTAIFKNDLQISLSPTL